MEEKLGLPPNMEVGIDRLKMLQDISEVREQARTLDRMELVRQREERNKAKFQHGLDFGQSNTRSWPLLHPIPLFHFFSFLPGRYL